MKTFATIGLFTFLGFVTATNLSTMNEASDVAAFISTQEITSQQEVVRAIPQAESEAYVANRYAQGWISLDKEYTENNSISN